MMKTDKKSAEKYIIHNPKSKKRSDKLNILRIHILPEFTKVDFGYVAKNHYDSGGWVQIYENTFIRDFKTGKKYSFIKAENISIAPEKKHFNSHLDYLYYSLYFEPIPADTKTIDIIENEEDDNRFFNFYKVRLDSAEKVQML